MWLNLENLKVYYLSCEIDFNDRPIGKIVLSKYRYLILKKHLF